MTKRQWRRLRGKMVMNKLAMSQLKRVEFSSMVMTQLAHAFLCPKYDINNYFRDLEGYGYE